MYSRSWNFRCFIDDLFWRKLNMQNILCNVRQPIPILVAKVRRRNLDYTKNLQVKYFTGENIPIYGIDHSIIIIIGVPQALSPWWVLYERIPRLWLVSRRKPPVPCKAEGSCRRRGRSHFLAGGWWRPPLFQFRPSLGDSWGFPEMRLSQDLSEMKKDGWMNISYMHTKLILLHGVY